MKVAAIIVAAGCGNRMGGGKNKLLFEIGGKTVIDRTLEVFSSCGVIDALILVTSDIDIKKSAEKFPRIIKTVAGGKTRTESVLSGLLASEGFDMVAIHDGARPLVTDEIIKTAVSAAKKTGAAVPGIQVFDTIKRTDDDGIILETPVRESLKSVQTPQVFNRELLINAYRSRPLNTTDDASVAESAGIRVSVVAGSRENIKITTGFDLLMAEAILKARDIV